MSLSNKLYDLAADLESVLVEVESGDRSAHDLANPLSDITGHTCGRSGSVAGVVLYDCDNDSWWKRAADARRGLAFAEETGKPARLELRRLRAKFAPLFAALAECREECFA